MLWRYFPILSGGHKRGLVGVILGFLKQVVGALLGGEGIGVLEWEKRCSQ